MEDNEKQTAEVTRSGTDWEVVSLTSSAYAAAPTKNEASEINSNQESSLFGSGHFVFPPNEHENLPVNPNEIEIKKREQENLPDKEEGEEEEREEGTREAELETVHQDQFLKKEEESQEFSSEIEKNREEVLESESESGVEKKREEEGEEGEEEGLEWVKQRGLWLYRHVKEANAVWSVVVAAALVGLVILGQRWQREKAPHQHQLK